MTVTVPLLVLFVLHLLPYVFLGALLGYGLPRLWREDLKDKVALLTAGIADRPASEARDSMLEMLELAGRPEDLMLGAPLWLERTGMVRDERDYPEYAAEIDELATAVGRVRLLGWSVGFTLTPLLLLPSVRRWTREHGTRVLRARGFFTRATEIERWEASIPLRRSWVR